MSNGVEFSVRPAISLEAFRGRWEWRPPARIRVSVPEGEEPATDTPVTFTFGGTAERGTDYEMAATVTLPAGERSVRTRLELIDDAHFELRETIILQAAAAGYLASPEVEAFIYDDDPAPLTLSADPASVSEAAGERTATITVSVPEAVGAPVEVTLNRSGTATSGVDYTLAETVTIPAGTSTTATLQVIDDRIDEGTETVEVQASADGYGPSDAVAVPIGDDDTAGLTVTPADLSLTEGGSGQYEVRLDSQPLHPVTITIASSNPDVEAPTPLSFTADNWNQFQAVTVTVAHDDDATDESATVTHTAESGDLNYQGIPVPSVSVSVSDDDNQPPRCDSIATRILRVADSQTVDLSEYCSDPDGHSLDYTASSSDTSKVTVSMTGSRLTLTGVAATASPHPRVTVTVTDGHGGSDSVEFPVTVREKPSCDLSSISDQTLFEDEERMLPLSSVCDVTYSASSSPSGIVTVSVNNSTDELTIRGQSVGTATVTVTVTGSGCESDSVSFQVTVEERPPSPEAFISASSVILDADGCTTLNWETENAASASISPGVGVAVKLNKEQSHRVCPDAKQQYTLTAIGEPGAIPPRDTASVTVRPPSPTASLTADPTTIFPGERTTLSWTTTNAVSGSINGEAIARSDLPSGSKQVQLNSSQAYTLSVLGRMGADPSTDTDGAYVKVVPRPDSPMIDSFGASPTTITAGGCTTLSWTTTDAVSVSISPAIGGEPLSVDGNGRVCPSSDETYKLTATGEEGAQPLTATASVTVTVNPPAPSSPVITSISPSLQRPDDRVTIYGNHFGSTAGSVSFGGHSVSIFSGPGYSWSNTSIGLLIPGSLSAGQVSVTVTTHGGSTSDSYSYTVTGGPVSRGDCEEGDEDCPEGKEDKESGDSDEGGTDEDPAEGGG